MDSIISTFHIDWKIIIAQAVNFGIVFVVLYIYALKPLAKLMAERGDKITKGIQDAKVNAEVLEKTSLEYEAMLANARKEANSIAEAGKKEAEAEKSVMLENARKEVSEIVANGKRLLESEKSKMLEEAKKEVVNLAILATEKLLSAKVDGSFNDKNVKEISSL